MSYFGLYYGLYLGAYYGDVAPAITPVPPAPPALIAVPAGIDHATDAINRLCEYAKSAATDANGNIIGSAANLPGFPVPLGGPTGVSQQLFAITRAPMFAVASYPPVIDHLTDAVNRLCEYAKAPIDAVLEEKLEAVEIAFGFDSTFDFPLG